LTSTSNGDLLHPERATVVSFSVSYYDVQQALIALKNSRIVKHHTRRTSARTSTATKIGSTSLAFHQHRTAAYAPTLGVQTRLTMQVGPSGRRIQALVADTPTAQYISSSEIPKSVLVGQFPSHREHYGLLFAKNDPLVRLREQGDRRLKVNGSLAKFQKEYPSASTTSVRRSSRSHGHKRRTGLPVRGSPRGAYLDEQTCSRRAPPHLAAS